jgi:signal transduction histidine kinase/Tfp pilus assembly protein PilF
MTPNLMRFTLLFLFAFPLGIFCKPLFSTHTGNPIDSLKNIILDQELDRTIRMNAIKKTLTNKIPFDTNVIIVLDNFISQKNNSNEEKFYLYYAKGFQFFLNNNMNEAEIMYDNANEYLDLSSVYIPDFYLKYGSLKNYVGKNTDAVDIYYQAIGQIEKNKDKDLLPNFYNNLGNVLAHMEKHEEATENFLKSIEISEKNNNLILAGHANKGLGSIFLNQGQYEKAEKYFLKAIERLKDKNPQLLNETKHNLGIVYEQLNRLDDAKKMYEDVENYYEEVNDQRGLANVNLDKGYLASKNKNYKLSINYCTTSNQKYKELDDLYGIINSYECLYNTAKDGGMYKEAILYLEKHIQYKDSLRNEKNIAKITEIRKDYEFSKEKDKIEFEHNAKIAREQLFRKYMGLVLALLLGLLFFAYRAYRIKDKSHKIITAQKDQIESYSQANENLIYTLSHDIKEPMLGIQLLLQKLHTNDGFLQKATLSMSQQVAAINSIVNNLIQLKKSSNLNDVQEIDITKIINIIQKIIQEVQYKINDRNISIKNTLDPHQVLNLPLSEQKLYIILLNLITNAIKHSPDHSNIEVLADGNGIYIKDKGKGIDPEILNKIGKDTINREDNSDGSGIGLVLMNNILKDTKMGLQFKNMEGGGTVVGLVLT